MLNYRNGINKGLYKIMSKMGISTIIVETASARDPHHFAVLLGFGATAIYPYLAYETLGRLVDTHAIAKD